MKYYPMFMDLSGARCLVVGAGRVGRRKLSTLLECGPALVLVLDTSPEALRLAREVPRPEGCALICEARAFAPSDADGMTLAFAATPSAQVNSEVARACRERGVPCNTAVALDGDGGSFLVPSRVEAGPLVLALSTGGASPALARALREDLESWLDRGYPLLIRLLEALRPRVLALGMGSDADARVFRAACAMPLRARLLEALAAGDHALADSLLRPVLPDGLDFSSKEILHGMD